MRFAPKEPVQLDPPKDTPITLAELSLKDGIKSEQLWVGIKGDVFDVTRNSKAYGPGTNYHVFCGKDASKALGKSSLEEEDFAPSGQVISWQELTADLSEKDLKTLEEWYSYFSQRYNIVGKIDLSN
ncbi:Membrane-associated progesterone receptor component 1 [Yarrowia sp. B02]|nr:Membrane-associated progesterone receptor component 1 [Yarrowia sp. B02]